jgi:hypothetical protein
MNSTCASSQIVLVGTFSGAASRPWRFCADDPLPARAHLRFLNRVTRGSVGAQLSMRDSVAKSLADRRTAWGPTRAIAIFR